MSAGRPTASVQKSPLASTSKNEQQNKERLTNKKEAQLDMTDATMVCSGQWTDQDMMQEAAPTPAWTIGQVVDVLPRTWAGYVNNMVFARIKDCHCVARSSFLLPLCLFVYR